MNPDSSPAYPPLATDQLLKLALYTLETAKDMIFWTDPHGRFIYANHAACELLEYTIDELLTLHVHDVSPDMPPDAWPSHFAELKASGSLLLEVRSFTRSGREVLLEVSTHYLQHEGREYACAMLRDITERKARELKISESLGQFEVIFNESPISIAITRLVDGKILEVNPTLVRLTGYSRAEQLGRTTIEILGISAADRERLIKPVQETGVARNVELRVYAKDGRQIDACVSSVPIEFQGEKCLLNTAMDVTAQRQAEAQLREAEANARARENQLRAIFDASQAGVILGNFQGEITFANQRMATMFGCSMDELIGSRYQEHIHPDQLDNSANHLRKLIVGEIDHVHHERHFLRKDGSDFWGHLSARRMIDAEGKFLGLVGVIADISDIKKAEQSIIQSEERYRKLVEQAAAWIWEIDAHLNPVYSNGHVASCLGYTVPEFLGIDLMSLLHPDDRGLVDELVSNASGYGKPWRGVILRWKHRDGSWRYLETSGDPLFDASGVFAGLSGVDIDVTDRVLLHEERDKAQRLESLGVLAGGIAHDFNNILTGIVGNVSFIRLLLGEEHRAVERLIDCEKAAMRAAELTRQLLTFSRGGEPVKTAVDTERILTEALSFSLRGSNVKGDLYCPPDLWFLNADAGQMSQVFNNLLINARQAMPGGGAATVRAENYPVHPGDQLPLPPGRYIRIGVSDEGNGIPAEELPRIFDPYFTTKDRGTGLGLASVYSIIRRHGGLIKVDSIEGKGTTFTLYLPAEDDGKPVQPNGARSPIKLQKGSGKVLVMDDDELIREMASLMLEESGYTVSTCSDGAQAIKLFTQAREEGAPYAAIILDLTVPGGMGGKEAAALIRVVDQDIPLIVSSGYSDDPVIAHFSSYGFSGAVNKPYSLQSITNELKRLLTRG